MSKGGGNVYLAGGTGTPGGFNNSFATEEAVAWNTFLNRFGLAFDTSTADYNGIILRVVAIASTHPLFAGVGSLFIFNGNDILDLDPTDPRARVLASEDGHGLYAVFEDQAPGLQIASISPAKGGNAGSVTVTVRGIGFAQGAVVRLREGSEILVTGQNTQVASQIRLQTTFDLRGQAPRALMLQVVNPDGTSAVAAEPFTVIEGGAPDVRIRKAGTRAVPGRILDYFIFVQNVGSVDATDVQVSEFLDRHFSLLSVDPPAVADIPALAAASAIMWNIPMVAPSGGPP